MIKIFSDVTILATVPGEPGDHGFRFDNALTSWGLQHVNLEVVFDTNEWVERNGYGTPLLPSLFKRGENAFEGTEIVAYVNADIILPSVFNRVCNIVRVEMDEFLVVGRRWNWHNPRHVKLDTSLDIGDMAEEWWREVTESALDEGSLFNPASDYFIFRTGVFDYGKWPDFAIGRYWWDPWIMWHAIEQGIPVIDATKFCLVIHQDHPPGHRSWDPEGEHNRSLVPDEMIKSGFDLDDVPYEMTSEGGIVKR